MMRNVVRQNSWLVAALVFGTTLTVAGSASAHDDPDQEPKATSSKSTPPKAERAEAAERAGEGEEEESKFEAGVELLVGFGKETIVTQELPGSLATVPTNVVEQSRVQTETLLLSAGWEATKYVAFGARIPFTFGGIDPATRDSRGTTALGALEFEAESTSPHFAKDRSDYAVGWALGLSLPTAQGDEIPSADDLATSTAPFNQTSLDRGVINKAASDARGSEDTALFESKRLGLTPKVSLTYSSGRNLTLTVWGKAEFLFSTSDSNEHAVVGETLFGVAATYKVHPQIDLRARVWLATPFGSDEKESTAVVEPQVRFHVSNVEPYIGGILPFAGALTNPYSAGIRAGVGAHF